MKYSNPKMQLIGIILLLTACSSTTDDSKDKVSSEQNNSLALDTELSKYEGVYAYNNGRSMQYINVGKFPENTLIIPEGGKKFLKLSSEDVGQYFILDGGGENLETTKIDNTIGGYRGRNRGNIFKGVASDGDVHYQNYVCSFSNDGDTIAKLKLQGSAGGGGVYKFIKRPDGKFNISAKNVIYEYISPNQSPMIGTYKSENGFSLEVASGNNLSFNYKITYSMEGTDCSGFVLEGTASEVSPGFRFQDMNDKCSIVFEKSGVKTSNGPDIKFDIKLNANCMEAIDANCSTVIPNRIQVIKK